MSYRYCLAHGWGVWNCGGGRTTYACLFAVARELFPDAEWAELNRLLWERSAYPSFWRTGDPCIEVWTSLITYRSLTAAGVASCDWCPQPAQPGKCECWECEAVLFAVREEDQTMASRPNKKEE